MTKRQSQPDLSQNNQIQTDSPPKALSEAAKRALKEAEARRRAKAENGQNATEIGGAEGPDPVRYGDWEKKGLISDF